MNQEPQQTAVVAICSSRISAEAAVIALHHAGLDMMCTWIDGHAPQGEERAIDASRAGEFVVLVHGTAAMIVHARAVLCTSDSTCLATHAAPYVSHNSTDSPPYLEQRRQGAT